MHGNLVYVSFRLHTCVRVPAQLISDEVMADSNDTEEERILAVQIRKLRKKLRQIENLELLDRPLTPEEKEKVKQLFETQF